MDELLLNVAAGVLWVVVFVLVGVGAADIAAALGADVPWSWAAAGGVAIVLILCGEWVNARREERAREAEQSRHEGGLH